MGICWREEDGFLREGYEAVGLDRDGIDTRDIFDWWNEDCRSSCAKERCGVVDSVARWKTFVMVPGE